MWRPTVRANDKAPKVIALVDADGILYSAALSGQVQVGDDVMALTTAEYLLAGVLDTVEELRVKVKADEAMIVLSDRVNFRTTILATYKGQRKASARPVLLDGIRRVVMEQAEFTPILIKGLEADDVCGIYAGHLQKAGRETIIVSPDKDLMQIPGKVYRKGILETVTEELGDRFHMLQTLMGDSCDNYRGCPGWGARKAGILLDRMDEEEMPAWARWEEIVKAFTDKGLTKEDALVQAQVSRICRVTDWDPKLKEVIPFQFPEKPTDQCQREAA